MKSHRQTWGSASGVLKTATLRKLEANLSKQGIAVVNSWAASNPKLVKEWEASGELLAKAQAAQEQASEVVDRARSDGMTHLADHEIYEMYGGPTLRL
jgi:hypothetical protein